MNPAQHAAGREPDVMEILAQARPARLDPDHPPAVSWQPASDFTDPHAGMDGRIDIAMRTRSAHSSPALLAHGSHQAAGRRVLAAVGSAAALGLVLAFLIAARPVLFPGRDHSRPAGRSQSAPASPTRPASPHSSHLDARAALLRAAAHVPHAAFGGRYWQTLTKQALIAAGGTRAHPYSIAVPQLRETWLSPEPGQRDYSFTEQLAARPATPADRAQWQAAGSPASWNYGTHPTTSGPTGRAASYWTGHGNIGFLEGDLPYIGKAQFARLPASPARLLATLRAKAKGLHTVTHRTVGGADERQIVWIELLQVVTGPVPWQVRAAAWRVLAGLPGMRSVGPMRDPSGRPGYGVSYHPGITGPQILVFDPATGMLLATEHAGAPDGLRSGQPRPSSGKLGHYYYRFHRGQIDLWTVFVTARWTNASPSLPVPPVRRAQSGY